METRGDQSRYETPFHRGGIQRLLLLIAGVGTIGIWYFAKPAPTTSPSIPQPTTPLLRVDLNTADTRSLSLLPSVGPTLANRIVENRERLGPFRCLEDLGRVHGIGEKSIAAMREFCCVSLVAVAEDVAQVPEGEMSRQPSSVLADRLR